MAKNQIFEKRTNWTGSYEKHCSGDDRYAYGTDL